MGDYVDSDDDYDYQDSDEGCDDEDDAVEGIEDDTEIVARGPSFKVITKESILAAQREVMHKVMDLLWLNAHHARTLLIHHRWDVDKVTELLVENGKEKLCAEAGVPTGNHNNDIPNLPSSVGCEICFDDVSVSDATKMECGHIFCNDCWTSHFIVKINEGKSRSIRCMDPNCNSVCDDAKIKALVGARDPYLAQKFDRFLQESYIEDNSRVKWCPSVPHCGNAISVDDVKLCEVECACGLQFCFTCLSEAHSPCSCLMWELWTKKCQDESETVNWMTVHTKPCPKCHKLVEKNGGCNLVCCLCGQAFCWLCGGATGRDHDWTTIFGHSCGEYKEEFEQKSQRAKIDLHRYMHYHNRYQAHLDSFKLESKLKESIQDKISKLEERDSISKDFSWIVNGLHSLSKFRRILSLTYPFAYYMFGGEIFKAEMTSDEKKMKRELFEDQQQQFEGNVERLSLLLEENFDDYDGERIKDLRARIIAVFKSTENLCRNLYDCIENDLLGSQQGTVHKISPFSIPDIQRIGLKEPLQQWHS
ncbi:hypothetical protein Tsubulata_039048 [Turnera subulata]|uniref:RBR-type E3 ubiquitin transferase n=1 Tax=Turnera subulata TaxID=218843 RepID=A0A9Q0FHU7_9ROSI|nr:hypothetical protein Tsubulata_039048 [Turnera subulata]